MKLLAVICLYFVSACSFAGSYSRDDNERAHSNIAPRDGPSFAKPIGNELKIDVREVSEEQYEIVAENVSRKPVFCSFLPGQGSERADYFPYGVEFRRAGEESFSFLPTAQDFVPPIAPLGPGQRVVFTFFPPDTENVEAGEYRIVFRYAVDPELERVKRTIPPEEIGEDLRGEILAAFRAATSPAINLSDAREKFAKEK